MSIQSEIDRIRGNVQSTLDVIADTGVAVPEGANSDALPAAAQTLAHAKQDKLTGAAGQIVGFDEHGQAQAQDMPAGSMAVNFTVSDTSTGTMQSDKTFAEIKAAYDSGYYVYGIFNNKIFQLDSIDATEVSFALQQSAEENDLLICQTLFFIVSASDVVNYRVSNALTYNQTSLNNRFQAIDAANKGYVDAQRPKQQLVTIPASGWNASTKKQTISAPGILADESKQLIQPVPRADSQAAYIEAGIRCTAQAENSLTFTAETVPTTDLSVYIVFQKVQ